MFEFDLDNAFENRYAFKEELPNKGTLVLAGKKHYLQQTQLSMI